MSYKGTKAGITSKMTSLIKRNMAKDTNIDKIKLHIVSGGKTQLAPQHKDTYDQLQFCRAIVEGRGGSRQEIVNIVVRELGVSEPRAYEIYRDTVKLYAEVSKLSKDEWRWIISEGLMSLAATAKSEKQYQLQLDCLLVASKVLGLTTQEAIERLKSEMPQITIQVESYQELEKKVQDIPHITID